LLKERKLAKCTGGALVGSLEVAIKGGCVVPCIVDVDVRTTPDERGVGAMVDATVANVMLYCALKPCLVIEKSVVNLILSNVVLSPLTVTVNPDLEPLSLSILWPKMSVNSTKSQQDSVSKTIN